MGQVGGYRISQEDAPINKQNHVPPCAEVGQTQEASLSLATSLSSPAVGSTTVSTPAGSTPSANGTTPPGYIFVSTPWDYKSPVWNYFRIVDPEHHPAKKEGDRYACCNTSLSPGHLKTHEKSGEADEYSIVMREKEQRLYASLNATKKKTFKQQQLDVLDATICWVIEENIPLSMVKKKP